MNNLDFEIQTLDEQRQIKNLTNAITFADSFSLLFVRCNQRPRQKEIIAELEKRLDGHKIKVIFLENQVEHLLEELEKRLGDEKLDAIFVYGLESSFPKADEAVNSKFVVTLNHSRNSFKKVLHCPLVLFLPEYALSAIYHGATDFYSIRSGVYLFSAKAEEIEQQLSQYSSPDYYESLGLLYEERQNNIKTIEKLLDEHKSLPHLQRDLEKEFSLKIKLADLYLISAKFDKAEKLYQEAINHFQKSNNIENISFSMSGLAQVYESQGRYNLATKLLSKLLEIDKNFFGIKHPNFAVTLNNLGTIYRRQGRYNQASKLFKESLKINREVFGTNYPEYATNLNNLSTVYHAQGRYTEAIALYKEALDISKNTVGSDHPEYAVRAANLSRLYYEQHKYREALNLADEAYKIFIKTLGFNHSQTKDILEGLKKCKVKIREKASFLVPYKN